MQGSALFEGPVPVMTAAEVARRGQLISIVGRYGTLDKEFTALMDQLIAAYNRQNVNSQSLT
jgi:hypothetical protein